MEGLIYCLPRQQQMAYLLTGLDALAEVHEDEFGGLVRRCGSLLFDGGVLSLKSVNKVVKRNTHVPHTIAEVEALGSIELLANAAGTYEDEGWKRFLDDALCLMYRSYTRVTGGHSFFDELKERYTFFIGLN